MAEIPAGMPAPLPAANLRALMECKLSSDAKILALYLAAEGPHSRDAVGNALKLSAWEVEAACRDLSRPQVRWMPRQYDSGRLDLVEACPIRALFAKKTKTPKEPTE